MCRHSIVQMMTRSFTFVSVLFLLLQVAKVYGSEAFEEKVWPFLDQHCTKCHSDAKAKGGLNLEQMDGEFIAGSREARHWQEVMDRMNLGEMPPEKEKGPDQKQANKVVAWILASLKTAIAESKEGAGRVVMRRLNKNEYNYTVQDLLGLKDQPADLFPADNTAHGFDNIGRALTMSPLLMEKYMVAGEKLLDRAIVTGERPKSVKVRQETENQYYRFTRQKSLRPYNGLMVRENDILLMSLQKYWLPSIDAYKFRRDGIYAFRVRAHSFEGGKYPPRMEMDFEGTKIWEGDVLPEARVIEVRVPVEVSDSSPRRVFKVAHSNHRTKQTMPIALDWLEIEGPIYDEWPPESHKRIFFKGDEAKEDESYAREIVKRFATKAFRRHLEEQEVEHFMKLFLEEQSSGSSFVESIKATLGAFLCSHDFLFLAEPDSAKARPLNAFELASRLSFFLWSSMPDEELFACAEDGSLEQAKVLEVQVRRMIADPKSQRFVKNFVGQWLQTRLVGSFPPDKKLFPDYEYHLERSMIQETESFFSEVLHQDLSALNFLDSDFTMLNQRLARHYGIEGVHGDDFRRVKLPADSPRGGVMTHASMLSGLSDGTRAKPIKRGVWVLENLLGSSVPPPPPNAGEIEPNKKGEKVHSLRERMAQHREKSSSCYSCHKKIDPLGFSLQNFDAVGAWRTHEPGVGEPIDASGEFADGTKYSNLDEFKKLLLARQDDFRRGLTEKLLTYALGRGLEVTDRKLVADLAAKMKADGDKLAGLITQIAQSQAFQTK